MTYSEAVKKRIVEICDQRRISTNMLATLSGVTQSTVQDLVTGKTKNPKLKTLHRIATGLGMTVSELLDFPEMNEQIFDDE